MKTCKIQWIDRNGKETPDQNPAIGHAWLLPYTLTGPQYSHGRVVIEESEHFPICAEHRARMIAEGLESNPLGEGRWTFAPIHTLPAEEF